jgi:hypothetical protein
LAKCITTEDGQRLLVKEVDGQLRVVSSETPAAWKALEKIRLSRKGIAETI